MNLWVDADACPKVIKDILFRVADRVKIPVTLVTNQRLHMPNSVYIHLIQVSQGSDIADDEIVNQCEAGDLVVTADIPLAARVVEKGAHALDPRGALYDQSNIGEILDMRNFMDSLRGSGVETGGPKAFSKREQMKFANELDKFLTARRG